MKKPNEKVASLTWLIARKTWCWCVVSPPVLKLRSIKRMETALFNSTGQLGGGPGVVVSTAAFHASVRGSVPGLGGLKETKMFLPHPRVKVSIVGSLRDREVACSASDRQGSNFESCVWRTVSSQSSHHPQEVLLAQFSLYVHKGGLKPDSFHFHRPISLLSIQSTIYLAIHIPTTLDVGLPLFRNKFDIVSLKQIWPDTLCCCFEIVKKNILIFITLSARIHWKSKIVIILWNSMTLLSFVFTELANTMKYGGGGLI